MNSTAAAGQQSPLAMICGGGALPLTVAQSVVRSGRSVVIFALRGTADPSLTASFPHHWVRIGQFGTFTRLAHAAGIRDIVFIGSLVRPSLWQLRPDLKALMALPRIMAAYRGGDDHLLSGVCKIVEHEGFRLIGAHEVAPEILVPEGALGHVQPSERDRTDIALGLEYLRAAGPYDVGQAVVVADKHILAVEAVEGTDQMLARIAALRANGRLRASPGSGVLVKAPKIGQDRRFDMPSIGPLTADGVARAGLAGIAVLAGSTIVAEPEKLVATADREKIFVIGTPAGSGQ